MEPGQLPDGTLQLFYWPDDHEEVEQRGWFKGMAQILRKCGLNEVAKKKKQSAQVSSASLVRSIVVVGKHCLASLISNCVTPIWWRLRANLGLK
jgi:hypothetical protein